MENSNKTNEELLKEIDLLKKENASLKKSKDTFQIIAENTNDNIAITSFDLKAKYLYVSPSVKRTLGYKPEELLGKSFFSYIHPNDKKIVLSLLKYYIKNFFGKLLNLDKSNTSEVIEFRFINKAGEWRHMQSTVNFLGKNLLAVTRDISKQKQIEIKLKKNEHKFRLLANYTYDWEYWVNPKGEYIYLSPSCERITGYKPEEFISDSELLFKIIRADYCENIRHHFADENNKELPHYSIEFPIITKDKKERWLEHNCSPVFDENDKFVGRRGNNRDITERKKSNEKILKLTTAVEQSANTILITNTRGKIEYTNPKFTDLTGYTAADALGRNPRILNAGTQDKEYYIQMWKVITSGKMWKGEFHNKKKNGDLFWENVTITPIKNEAGIITNYLSIKEDITEKKHAEEQIRKLSTAVKQSPSIIMITSTDGRIEYVNPKYSEITGYCMEETIGQLPKILQSGELSSEVFIDLWNKITSGESWKGKFRNKKKNGELFWESTSISPIFNKKGEIINYIKVAEDITERIRNEQIQKVLFNISNAVNTTINLKKLISIIQTELGSIIDTTNFYVALYNPENNTISSPYMSDEKDSFTDFPAGKTLTYYVIKTGKPLLGTKTKLQELEKSGEIEGIGTPSEIWLGVPLKIDGKIFGVYAVQSYTDEKAYGDADLEMLEFIADQISISIERKRAEDDLLLALKKAKESDELKSAFLANMSHEIRTPMNGILGFTGLLQEPDLTKDEIQEYSNVIERNGARMLETVTNLIDISKIEAGQMNTVLSEVNITKQIKNLFEFFKPEAESKNLHFSYTIPKTQIDIILKTDEIKLYSILSNLIKNAIKYTDNGSVVFGFSFIERKIIFYIKDTGIGITKEKQSIIFNRFVQANLSLASKYEGAGLGLSIAKAYTEMIDGKIWLESQVNEGTTFFFQIPFNEIHHIETKEKPAISMKKSSNEFKEIKILIAEDDETSVLYLDEITKSISNETIYAKTGQEAVEICHERSDLDLVLMDIKMPEMNGLDAIKRIREFNKNIIIIVQTAYALRGDREKVMAVGCNDYISKPINKKHLLEIIGKYFKK